MTKATKEELSTAELIKQFEAGTLPKKDWTHESNIKVALWYICNSSNQSNALSRLKAGIIFHNCTMYGFANGFSMYHETATVFLFKKIYCAYKRVTVYSDFDELLNTLLESNQSFDKDYLNNHYSEARLSSPAAKAIYMSPDIKE